MDVYLAHHEIYRGPEGSNIIFCGLEVRPAGYHQDGIARVRGVFSPERVNNGIKSFHMNF